MQFTWLELWGSMGGVARAVVALLASMSIASLAVAGERWRTLSRAASESARFLAVWRERVAKSGVLGAADDASSYPHSPAAHVIAAGTAVLAAGLDPESRREAYDRTVRRSILASNAAMKRGLAVIATVGSTAPFVGLVGTVIGIVNAFQQLAAGSQGGVGQVSAGIAEALVTTAFGIAVAIPAVWLYNSFTAWTTRATTEIECVAEELAVAALGERPSTPRALEARR